MKCKEKDCGGKVEISPDKAVSLQTGAPGHSGTPRTDAYPCDKCGSLHYDDGTSVKTGAGENVFLLDGKVLKKSFFPNRPAGKQMVIKPLDLY